MAMIVVNPRKFIVVALMLSYWACAIPSSHYIRLITEVRNQFVTSSVLLLYDSFNDFEELEDFRKFIRMLSMQGVCAMSVDFESLASRIEFHKTNRRSPLIVVFLNSEERVAAFSKLTENYIMTYPVWVLIFDENVEPRNSMTTQRDNIFHLTFDTRMLVFRTKSTNIEEWYSLHNETRTADLATWDSTTGLVLRTNQRLYQRRRNLENTTITVAINDIPWPADKYPVVDVLQRKIVAELADILNFNIKTISITDKVAELYGDRVPGPNEVIELLQAGEANITTVEIVMDSRRMDSVDFIFPLIITRRKLFIREPEGGIQWSGYFKIFSSQIWWTLGVFILSTLVLLTTSVAMRGDKVSFNSIVQHLLLVLGIYCQQGLLESPTTWPLKITCFFTFISALVIYAAYSGTLTSRLAVTNLVLPFSSLESYLADGTYKLSIFVNSAEYEMLKNPTDQTLIKLSSMLRPTVELPTNSREVARQICRERVAFMDEEIMMKQIARRAPCKIIGIGQNHQTHLAIAISKNNPFRGVIDYYVKRLLSVGIVDRIHHSLKPPMDPPVVAFYEVTFVAVAPILMILGGGIAIAVVILFIEMLCWSRSSTPVTSSKQLRAAKLTSENHQHRIEV